MPGADCPKHAKIHLSQLKTQTEPVSPKAQGEKQYSRPNGEDM